MRTVRGLREEQRAESSLEESQETSRRCEAWIHEGGFRRYMAIRACAKAGSEALANPAFVWGTNRTSDAINIACAGQILFGEYDDEKVAEPEFVAAVLAEAERQPDLADAPCWRRKR